MNLPEPADSGYFNDDTGKMEPLFTATQMREYRNQALEDAAKMCDEVDKESQSQWPHRFATMIRALKEK